MTSEQKLPVQAIKCPASRRREALLQLAAAYDPAQQAALSAAVKAMYNQPDAQWDGLWITIEAGQLVSAIWVQPLPMNMAQLWLPKELSSERSVHTSALLRAANAWVNVHNIRLCHLVLSPHAPASEALLVEHGMQRLACLEHLTVSSKRRLMMHEAIPLSLQPLSEFSQSEQLALLAAVGQDSLDSRPLRDVLSVEELLAGFYQQDSHAPQHWYAVGYQEVVVGVLLLAPRPAQGGWELMLMGLTPDWRGKGLGRSLLNKALELAQQAGVQEVMLGVDDANVPAKQLYREAGFVRYAQQRLLAWKGGGKGGGAAK
ncbi:GNAT family N-acetyltransferase [Halomonas alkaliantarctica]|uniref:GNAT family N-acetyltransferase n=1 Tax=Halomonas alkaliantarctica TaxID=232346 RepID=A0ABY8LM24_9GAMM|nr:GNAT family N-acetyltransferase [Halomonas alkaliantarctica]WGI25430.1 GNAT family N-acetyltransferase [Halomonas alkaliantarctica]